MSEQVKTCSKCKQEKEYKFFYKASKEKLGIKSCCKICSKPTPEQRRRKNEQQNLKRLDPEYRNKHRAKSILSTKKWRKINKEKVRGYERKHRISNKDKIKSASRRHTEKSRDSMDDQWIKGLIAQRSRMKWNSIPQELIELKRVQLQITRELRKQNKCQKQPA